ncbi:MAG: response regulator [Magnetococcales bacterium]|nr:response regulator [Magnetococcales bacterium]
MKDIQPVTVVMVEDEDAHATLIERNLRRGGIINPIVRLKNGQEVLDFLFNQGQFTGHVRPSHLLVMLDLNMPEVDGYQVLHTMKHHEETRLIPVVILTTTNDPHEVQRCYELGCNNFVSKPVDPVAFAKTIQSMGVMMAIMSYPCCL